MAGGDDLGGRRAISEQEERLHLRIGLMDRYRADRRYQGIVRQDLAPLWRAADVASAWVGDRPVSFADVLDRLAELEKRPAAAAAVALVERYVRKVGRTVTGSMGLTSEGYPPGWALRDVHDDVTGRPCRSGLLAVSPRAQDDDLALSLDVTPNFVGARYFGGGDGAPREHAFDLSQLGVGYGPEHWDVLRTTTWDVVTEAVDAMRRSVESRYPARNPTAVAGWQRDLDALHRVLFDGEPPANQALATRLRKLVRSMGIDPPTRRPTPPLRVVWDALPPPVEGLDALP